MLLVMTMVPLVLPAVNMVVQPQPHPLMELHLLQELLLQALRLEQYPNLQTMEHQKLQLKAPHPILKRQPLLQRQKPLLLLQKLRLQHLHPRLKPQHHLLKLPLKLKTLPHFMGPLLQLLKVLLLMVPLPLPQSLKVPPQTMVLLGLKIQVHFMVPLHQLPKTLLLVMVLLQLQILVIHMVPQLKVQQQATALLLVLPTLAMGLHREMSMMNPMMMQQGMSNQAQGMEHQVHSHRLQAQTMEYPRPQP